MCIAGGWAASAIVCFVACSPDFGSVPLASPQIDLEREAKAAVGKEKELVEKALAAEQRLAEAVRKVGRRHGWWQYGTGFWCACLQRQQLQAMAAAAEAAAALPAHGLRRPRSPVLPPSPSPLLPPSLPALPYVAPCLLPAGGGGHR